MLLRKYLNNLVRIDPEGKIGEFVNNITYLEARALKDTIYTIDLIFADTIDSIMPRVDKLHIYSGIFQHYIYEIGDITIEVDIGNCLDTYEFINDFVGIKASMTYYGLESPLNITIRSSDKNASGYIDYHDWGEFVNVFVETLRRYINANKKGSPKFKYLFDKENKFSKHAESRLNVKEDLGNYIQNLSNDKDICEHIQSYSNRRPRYEERRTSYAESTTTAPEIINSTSVDSYTIPAGEFDEDYYDDITEENTNENDTYTEESTIEKYEEDSKEETPSKENEPVEEVTEELEPVELHHEAIGLEYNVSSDLKSDGVIGLVSDEDIVDFNLNSKPDKLIIETEKPVETKDESKEEVIEIKEEITPPKPKIIINKNKKRRS